MHSIYQTVKIIKAGARLAVQGCIIPYFSYNYGMNWREITNREEWGGAFRPAEGADFLQSYEWGEFQNSVGYPAVRLANSTGDRVQGFIHNIGFGQKYAYFPRARIEAGFMPDLIDYLKTKNIFFARFEPINEIDFTQPESAGIKVVAAENRQPKVTLTLDLKKTEEQLLTEMHAKTRYNIRLAEKKGVVVREEKNADIFWKLNQDTTGRDFFKSHGFEYYRQMLNLEMARQLTAYYEGKPIASNIFINHEGSFIYLHGASSNASRNVMAPYLLQWCGIQLAKKLGAVEYDFWGISPPVGEGIKNRECYNNYCWDRAHPWNGVTRFKAGFGGTIKEYPTAFEVAIGKTKYDLFNLIKKMKGR